jgi:hypothetical protein
MNNGRPPTLGDSPFSSGRGGHRGSSNGRGNSRGSSRGNGRGGGRGGGRGRGGSDSSTRCYNCKEGNHMAKNCPKPCNACHSETHTTTNCPVRLSELMKSAEEADRLARTKPPITCTYCLEMRGNGVTPQPVKPPPTSKRGLDTEPRDTYSAPTKVSRTDDISTGTTGTPSSAQPAQTADPEASSSEMNCGEDDGGETLEGDEPQTKPTEPKSAARPRCLPRAMGGPPAIPPGCPPSA